MFGGSTGPLRLLNSALGGQAGWLLGFALVSGLAILLATRLRRADARSGWLLAVGGAFLTTAVLFSAASGIFHPYYVSLLAPFAAALVGAGVGAAARRQRCARGVRAARARRRRRDRARRAAPYPGQLSWLAPVLIAACALAAVALAAGAPPRACALAAAVVAVGALLLAPAVWAVDTLGHATSGTFPEGGPANVQTARRRHVRRSGRLGRRGFGGAPWLWRRGQPAQPRARLRCAPARLGRQLELDGHRWTVPQRGQAGGASSGAGSFPGAGNGAAAAPRPARPARLAGTRRGRRCAAGFGGGGMGAPFGNDATTTVAVAYVKTPRRRHDRRVQPVERRCGDHRQRREGRRHRRLLRARERRERGVAGAARCSSGSIRWVLGEQVGRAACAGCLATRAPAPKRRCRGREGLPEGHAVDSEHDGRGELIGGVGRHATGGAPGRDAVRLPGSLSRARERRLTTLRSAPRRRSARSPVRRPPIAPSRSIRPAWAVPTFSRGGVSAEMSNISRWIETFAAFRSHRAEVPDSTREVGMRSCVRFSFLALLVGAIVAVAAPAAQAAFRPSKILRVELQESRPAKKPRNTRGRTEAKGESGRLHAGRRVTRRSASPTSSQQGRSRPPSCVA